MVPLCQVPGKLNQELLKYLEENKCYLNPCLHQTQATPAQAKARPGQSQTITLQVINSMTERAELEPVGVAAVFPSYDPIKEISTADIVLVSQNF